MLTLLHAKLKEVARAVAPLVGVVCTLQATVVQAPAELFLRFIVGVVVSTAGMALLFAGIEMGILPMGRHIGAELPKRRSLWFIVAVAFALGFATTVAEPDVLVLSRQVEATSEDGVGGQGLVYMIAAGVGLFVALALVRVVLGISMNILLTVAYSASIAVSVVVPELVPLAYDAGSVTTGVVSAPVILALALGVSSVLKKRSVVEDGFGLLGLASVGPILVVLLLGWLRM